MQRNCIDSKDGILLQISNIFLGIGRKDCNAVLSERFETNFFGVLKIFWGDVTPFKKLASSKLR